MSLAIRLTQAALSPAITGMVTKVYIPILFPLTFLIGISAINLDRFLDFSEGFLPTEIVAGIAIHYWIAICSFVLGAILWLWTYEQLTVKGEGSPSPTAGRTLKLVRSGIYAHTRNPSLFGKILGVLAVGFALNSFSFCCILIPLILCASLIEKVVRQEPQLVAIFGEEYEEYRRDVPLFIPWKLFLLRQNRGNLQT
jgi:protein-S-isoprenylcysteine O-methyltransferase Ste14